MRISKTMPCSNGGRVALTNPLGGSLPVAPAGILNHLNGSRLPNCRPVLAEVLR